jgi:hypothetical protein
MAFKKLLVPLVVVSLATSLLPRASAGDFFGTPNGPGLGAAPSAPEEIPAATPPPKATPKPKSFKPAKPAASATPDPAAPITSDTAPPPFTQALGPAQAHLRAWFSFNAREQGGLTWSAEPIAAALSPSAVLKDGGGQRFADLGAVNAALTFTAALPLGKRYTIAAWVLFPIKNKYPTVFFRGHRNELLTLQPSGLFASSDGWRPQAFGDAMAPQTGWHHVALTADGQQSTVYVDGRLHGTVPGVPTDDLAIVGNNLSEYYDTGRSIAVPMDDVAIFNRELSDAEVFKLATLHGPTTMSSSSIASTKTPFKSALDTSPKPSALAPATTPIAAQLATPAPPVSSLPPRMPVASVPPPVTTLPAAPPSVPTKSPGTAAAVAAPPLPPFVQALGPIQTNLKAWFSFNAREKGGVAWSSEPMGAILSAAALLKESGGQRVADFSAEGAVMTFGTPVELGAHYTLTAWVLFPIKNKNISIIFRGSRADLLNVQPTGLFGCWAAGQTVTFGDAAAPLSGWHHIALSVDGKQSLVYVDGRVQGSLPIATTDQLATIGNHPSEYQQNSMMSAAMDDIAIFTRDLSEAEIMKVAQIRCATTMSTGGMTSPMVPFKSALDQPAKAPKQ